MYQNNSICPSYLRNILAVLLPCIKRNETRNVGIDLLEPETWVIGFVEDATATQMLRLCQKYIRVEDANVSNGLLSSSLYFVCKGRQGNKTILRYIVAAIVAATVTVKQETNGYLGNGTSGTHTHGLTIVLLFFIPTQILHQFRLPRI